MFECVESVEADLTGLLDALARVGSDGESDVLRVEQLTALERVKAACAAAQARVTVDLVESQAQVAEQWRARGRECSDAGDFEGWRAAREQARAATWDGDGDGDDAEGPECVEGMARRLGGDGTAAGGDGMAGAGGARERRRQRRLAGTVGVAAQVALARRVSPHRGSRCVGVAVALVEDLPWVLSQVEAGAVSERRAEIIVCETSHLTPDQRGQVDEALRQCRDEVGQWGDRDLARRVKAIAYRLDAQAAVDRAAYAVTQRRVSIRPAPDCMAWVTALLPVAQGVAVHASLMRDAATTIAATASIIDGGAGDERSKGQVMADRLVELVTGHAVVGPADRVGVEVQVVITDRALLGAGADGGSCEGDEVASVRGYGPVPARWVRDLLTPRTTTRAAAQTTATREASAATSPDLTGSGETAATVAEATEATEATGARVWVRRLLTDRIDGSLTGMDTGRRLFDGALRRFLLARDETCRTPWCDAPARHADHVTPYARGGPTTADNGQGLCVRCNLAKEQPGWTHRVVTANSGDPSDPRQQDEHTHTVETTTPTGHRHRSHAPPVLPRVDLTFSESLLEGAIAAMLAA